MSQTWLSERSVDGYARNLEMEATIMIKTLFNASRGGSLPVNTQVRCIHNP